MSNFINSTGNGKAIIAVAWPYANGDLHLGHPAGYLLAAGVMNDYLRLRGVDVIMVSGSDMHGTPVAVKAWKEGITPQEYALAQHKRHMEVMDILGLKFSMYTSTATEIHRDVVQELFKVLVDSGYIFKKKTEQYWSEKEHKFLLDRYIEGECPFCGFAKARGDQCDNCGHTLTPDELKNPYSIFGDDELVKRASTNYFLDLSKLQPLLEEYYQDNSDFGNWRRHVAATTKAWLAEGLKPRAITRDMEGYGVALPLGYEVEGEEGKVIYVWFEAVTGYLSASVALSAAKGSVSSSPGNSFSVALDQIASGSYSSDTYSSDTYSSDTYDGQSLNWSDYWLATDTKSYYFMGKDNIPFHSVIWPAMLLGLENSDSGVEQINKTNILAANQYLNLKGAKFSKSTGNMIDTREFFSNFGTDAARYFLISRMPENKDYDFTWEEFMEANNSELLANLGNFFNRTLVFWNKHFAATGIDSASEKMDQAVVEAVTQAWADTGDYLEKCEFSKGLARVMELGNFANKYFNDREIWQLVKSDQDEAQRVMVNFMYLSANLARILQVFLPEMSKNVSDYLRLEGLDLTVGQDNWRAVQIEDLDLVTLAEIENLRPLVKKLELDLEQE